MWEKYPCPSMTKIHVRRWLDWNLKPVNLVFKGLHLILYDNLDITCTTETMGLEFKSAFFRTVDYI